MPFLDSLRRDVPLPSLITKATRLDLANRSDANANVVYNFILPENASRLAQRALETKLSIATGTDIKLSPSRTKPGLLQLDIEAGSPADAAIDALVREFNTMATQFSEAVGPIRRR